MQTLETERLKLLPFSLELKKATMTERARLTEMLGVRVPDSWPGADLAEALPLFIELMEKDPTGEVWDGIIRSRRKTPAFMREDTSRAARRQSPFPMLLLLTFYAHSGIFVPVLLHTDNSILFGVSLRKLSPAAK